MNFLRPAVEVLVDYRRRPQANLRLVLTRALRDYRGDDRNALTRAVYGVARKQIALERVIGLFLKDKERRPPLPTQALLHVAAFLILYSDSYPDYAVVNEAVGVAAKKEKPFVNAVLRQLLRRRREVEERLRDGRDPVLAYSISPLLLDALRRLGAAGADDLAYLDREPVFHLRFHPGRQTLEAARRELEAAAVPCRVLPGLGCFETVAAGLILGEARGDDGDAGSGLGSFYVQNSGSQAVAFVAAAKAAREVCDAAAAPGGKSMTLACLRPDLRIFASDISLPRLRLLKQNIGRLRLETITPLQADALDYPRGAMAPDLVLLDAPCTASGTLRKNPDLKAKITAEAARAGGELQGRMLAALAARFPKAKILYAVCSFLPQEGEEVAARAAATGYRPAPLAPLLARYGFRIKQEKHGVYLLPSDLNNDLFYIALLEPK